MTIQVADKELKFRSIPIINLREDYVYELIRTGRMSQQQFAKWVENERDTWFNNGSQSKGE